MKFELEAQYNHKRSMSEWKRSAFFKREGLERKLKMNEGFFLGDFEA